MDRNASEWPPAPARLFQALVAGAARGMRLADEDVAALEWLETLKAPIIAVPASRPGQSYTTYVPSNDLDTIWGPLAGKSAKIKSKNWDPKNLGKIRTEKSLRSKIFCQKTPLLFAWSFDTHSPKSETVAEDHTRTICRMAEQLYQLGRGVNMAWAWAELVEAGEAETRLDRHGGVVYRPTETGTGQALLCPAEGSLASLRKRYKESGNRFTTRSMNKQGKPELIFRQPPKPRFTKVVYDAKTQRFLFELRTGSREESFAPWPLVRATELVVSLRDKAVEKLKEGFPGEVGTINRVLVGRDAREADKAARVRILPLPSIGHEHADRKIRRVLVEVPPNCPLRADDIAWAFSGIAEADPETGEIRWNLVPAEERNMLKHYGVGNNKQDDTTWRTVTPAALTVRRIRRTRNTAAGIKRLAHEESAAHAVIQALRHAGIKVPTKSIRIQREPLAGNETRAERFACHERFPARCLHHLEITFSQAVAGPLVIGNGRYLGLGLMSPSDLTHSVFMFALPTETNASLADAQALIHATRRALMSLAKDNKEPGALKLFSGHDNDSNPARSGKHRHIFLAADGSNDRIHRLIVAAPWSADRKIEMKQLDQQLFSKVIHRLRELRAGALGRFNGLTAEPVEDGDPLIGPADTWIGKTTYMATRHLKKTENPVDAIKSDVINECMRRGLPIPTEIDVAGIRTGPRGGQPAAKLKLRFAIAIRGPILLGKNSHAGGGMFHAASHTPQ